MKTVLQSMGFHYILRLKNINSCLTQGRRCYPQGNKKLSCIKNGEKVCDDFCHEQCLVIKQNGKLWLLSGCAHNGILNILDRYKELFDSHPDYVITGFHMMKREGKHTEEEKAVIIQTAQELSQLIPYFTADIARAFLHSR